MTLEDETGVVHVVIWRKVLESFRKAVLGGHLMTVRGRVQRAGGIVHLVAASLEDLTCWLDLLTPNRGSTRAGPRGATGLAPSPPRHPRKQRVIPRSRDFR